MTFNCVSPGETIASANNVYHVHNANRICILDSSILSFIRAEEASWMGKQKVFNITEQVHLRVALLIIGLLGISLFLSIFSSKGSMEIICFVHHFG